MPAEVENHQIARRKLQFRRKDASFVSFIGFVEIETLRELTTVFGQMVRIALGFYRLCEDEKRLHEVF